MYLPWRRALLRTASKILTPTSLTLLTKSSNIILALILAKWNHAVLAVLKSYDTAKHESTDG